MRKNISKVLVILLSTLMSGQVFAESDANLSVSNSSAKENSQDAIIFKVNASTGLTDSGATEEGSAGSSALPSSSYMGLDLSFFVPINNNRNLFLFTDLNMKRIGISDTNSTAVVPSLVVGISNLVACRWCYSLGIGAERAAIFKSWSAIKGLDSTSAFYRVALMKIQADLGYRIYEGSWAFGPEVHYEWLQSRDNTDFSGEQTYLSSTNRICPKLKFNGVSGSVKNISMAAVYCSEFFSLNTYDRDAGSVAFRKTSQSVGAEVAYQF